MTDFSIVIEDPFLGPRRLAKVVTLSDGGWALVPNYHPKPHPGYLLTESSVDYSKVGRRWQGRSDLLRTALSAGPVKLSIHADGFVQISRAGDRGVVSGVDPTTRTPRGFGLRSRPIVDPPRTGPTFAVLAWGLAGYPAMGRRRADDLVVGATSLYFEKPDLEMDRDGYVLEFWVFPRWALPNAKKRGELTILWCGHHAFYAGAAFESIVLDTGHPLMILGLVVTAVATSFDAESGASLASPSDRAMQRVLHAISPPPYDDDVPSADYSAERASLPAASAILRTSDPDSDVELVRPWGRRLSKP